jgi:hypothetical protein
MGAYLYDNDYVTDFLKWIKILEEKQIKPIYYKNTFSYDLNELEQFQQEILVSKNSSLAYFFANEFSYKTYLMQKIIIDNEDYKYAYLFAQTIDNADIKTLQNIVIKSNKIKYICKFACFVKTNDLTSLETIILQSKNAKTVHMFIKYVKGTDINKFKNIILDSKKPRYLFELAKHITDPKDIIQIEDLIIETKSFTYIRLLAQKIKYVNVEKLEQAILDLEDISEISKFAKNVKQSKMKRFLLIS